MGGKPEIYISTDIEADGPIPGPHSMLSFASVAIDRQGTELGCFSANLENLPGATGDPKTMDWWQTQPAAWEACRRDLRDPAEAMPDYVTWIDDLPGKPVFVAYPLLFDMMFVYWYLIRYVGRSPFSHSGIDIKTLAYVGMGAGSYRSASKRNMPKAWLPPQGRHTHVALDDAREQGELFINILNALPPAPTA